MEETRKELRSEETSKAIKFGIERLIMNSAGELSFRGRLGFTNTIPGEFHLWRNGVDRLFHVTLSKHNLRSQTLHVKQPQPSTLAGDLRTLGFVFAS